MLRLPRTLSRLLPLLLAVLMAVLAAQPAAAACCPDAGQPGVASSEAAPPVAETAGADADCCDCAAPCSANCAHGGCASPVPLGGQAFASPIGSFAAQFTTFQVGVTSATLPAQERPPRG